MSNARFSVLQAKAVSDAKISNAQFRTLAALGIFGDKDGWCFPKLATLAEMLGKSRQAVSRDIHALLELGYLQIHRQYRPDGGMKHNKYRLLFDTPINATLRGGKRDDDTPSTSEVEAPSTSEVDALTPHSNAPIDLTPQQQIVGALAEVTGLDYKIKTNAGRLAKRGKELLDAGYSPEQVVELYSSPSSWWYHNDWRGEKGQKPRPEQVLETISQAVEDTQNISRLSGPQKIRLPSGEIVETEI